VLVLGFPSMFLFSLRFPPNAGGGGCIMSMGDETGLNFFVHTTIILCSCKIGSRYLSGGSRALLASQLEYYLSYVDARMRKTTQNRLPSQQLLVVYF
jgi:hypothetical protein